MPRRRKIHFHAHEIEILFYATEEDITSTEWHSYKFSGREYFSSLNLSFSLSMNFFLSLSNFERPNVSSIIFTERKKKNSYLGIVQFDVPSPCSLFPRVHSETLEIYLLDSYKLLLGNLRGIQTVGHERLVVLLGKTPLSEQKMWQHGVPAL